MAIQVTWDIIAPQATIAQGARSANRTTSKEHDSSLLTVLQTSDNKLAFDLCANPKEAICLGIATIHKLLSVYRGEYLSCVGRLCVAPLEVLRLTKTRDRGSRSLYISGRVMLP